MIAGPSSSGKTTFSHRLSIQLRASGFKPHAIGVDNYFVEREQTPVDENGEYNFEDLHAIDIKLFNDHMNALLRGEKVEIPQFNFLTGRKEYNGDYIQLGEEDILVIEGIHCLNDELSYALPVESKFKIYISALTQLNVDEHNRVATTDGRLIRRMARDYRTRGASAKRTLSMWESVRKGEEKNIFPFQEEADAMFNSAMAITLFFPRSLLIIDDLPTLGLPIMATFGRSSSSSVSDSCGKCLITSSSISPRPSFDAADIGCGSPIPRL